MSFRVVLLSTGDATHQLLSWHAWMLLPLSHTAAGKCGRKMADVYGKVFPPPSEAAEQKNARENRLKWLHFSYPAFPPPPPPSSGGNFKSFISCSLPFFQRKEEGFPRKWTRWFQRTSRFGRCCVCGFFWVVSIVWRNVVDLNARRSFATPSIVIGVGPTNAERQLPVALWCVHRFFPEKL